DEADPVDVDQVDPHVLDHVDLATREHREAVAGIVAELLRPDVDRAGLAHLPPARVFRREDDDLVSVGLELPAGRHGRRDTADGSDFGGPTLTLWTARAALIIARSRASQGRHPMDSRCFAGSFRGDLRIDNLDAATRSIRVSESEGDLGPRRFDRAKERLAE